MRATTAPVLSRWSPASPAGHAVAAAVIAVALASCSLLVDTSNLSGEADDSGSGSDGGDGGGPQDADAAGDQSVPGDAAMGYAAVVMATGPLAYFRFDEPAGSKTVSSSVGTFSGSFTRGVVLGTPSPIGRDPTNTGATFSTPGSLDSDLSLGQYFTFEGNKPFSIEVWLNPSIVDASSRHVVAKADRGSQGPLNGWSLVLGQIPQPVAWFERGFFGDGGTGAKSFAPISTGSFAHVVQVYDGSALLIYVNGVAFAAPTPMTTPNPVSAAPAFVGSANGGQSNGHGYVGVLDELAIYDKALNQAQVTAHFQAGKPQ